MSSMTDVERREVVADRPSRPWRKHVTPMNTLLEEEWEGEGTEEKPYLVKRTSILALFITD
jgi:hypothetical protein